MFPLRDENPTHRFPYVVVGLIILNVGIFLYGLSLSPARSETFVLNFGLLPYEVARNVSLPLSLDLPPYLSLLTSLFLHAGWMHLLGNLWFLWLFGDNIEDFFGHVRFLVFYLLMGVVAGVAHVRLEPDSMVPTVGASGAIAGVLGAYLVLHPNITVRALFPWGLVIRMRALVFLGLWFVLQVFGLLSPRDPSQGGIAFAAHLGGFLAGALVMFFHPKRRARARGQG